MNQQPSDGFAHQHMTEKVQKLTVSESKDIRTTKTFDDFTTSALINRIAKEIWDKKLFDVSITTDNEHQKEIFNVRVNVAENKNNEYVIVDGHNFRFNDEQFSMAEIKTGLMKAYPERFI